MERAIQLKIEIFDILREQSRLQSEFQKVAAPIQLQLQELEAKKTEKLKELSDVENNSVVNFVN